MTIFPLLVLSILPHQALAHPTTEVNRETEDVVVAETVPASREMDAVTVIPEMADESTQDLPVWESIETPEAETVLPEWLPEEAVETELQEPIVVPDFPEEEIFEEAPLEAENEAPAPVLEGLYLGVFESTAYSVGDGMTPGTVTRNGTDVSRTIYSPEGYRLIAVDMNVIPLNSLVRVHIPGWEPFLARAADTGSAIIGQKIDLLMHTPADALQYGRQYGIEIYLIN